MIHENKIKLTFKCMVWKNNCSIERIMKLTFEFCLIMEYRYFILQYLTQILRPIPLPPLSMLLVSIWDSFLAQASVFLLCQYTATLSREKGRGTKGLIYFCKVNHSRIYRNFSRNWVGLNNLHEILSQNLRKLGK